MRSFIKDACVWMCYGAQKLHDRAAQVQERTSWECSRVIWNMPEPLSLEIQPFTRAGGSIFWLHVSMFQADSFLFGKKVQLGVDSPVVTIAHVSLFFFGGGGKFDPKETGRSHIKAARRHGEAALSAEQDAQRLQDRLGGAELTAGCFPIRPNIRPNLLPTSLELLAAFPLPNIRPNLLPTMWGNEGRGLHLGNCASLDTRPTLPRTIFERCLDYKPFQRQNRNNETDRLAGVLHWRNGHTIITMKNFCTAQKIHSWSGKANRLNDVSLDAKWGPGYSPKKESPISELQDPSRVKKSFFGRHRPARGYAVFLPHACWLPGFARSGFLLELNSPWSSNLSGYLVTDPEFTLWLKQVGCSELERQIVKNNAED